MLREVTYSNWTRDSSRQMFRRLKSSIFEDMPKPTLRLSTNFLSQTRTNLLLYPLFVVVCRQLDICWKKFTHRPPGKYFFWSWDPKKGDVGWKNDSKQLLLSCCYTNFCSFAHKSQLLTQVFGHKIAICGQTNKNEYSSTRAKVA